MPLISQGIKKERSIELSFMAERRGLPSCFLQGKYETLQLMPCKNLRSPLKQSTGLFINAVSNPLLKTYIDHNTKGIEKSTPFVLWRREEGIPLLGEMSTGQRGCRPRRGIEP